MPEKVGFLHSSPRCGDGSKIEGAISSRYQKQMATAFLRWLGICNTYNFIPGFPENKTYHENKTYWDFRGWLQYKPYPETKPQFKVVVKICNPLYYSII